MQRTIFFVFCFENVYNFDFYTMQCSLQGCPGSFFQELKKKMFSQAVRHLKVLRGNMSKTDIIYLKIL